MYMEGCQTALRHLPGWPSIMHQREITLGRKREAGEKREGFDISVQHG